MARNLRAQLSVFYKDVEVAVRPWIRQDPEAPWKVDVSARVNVVRAEALEHRCNFVAQQAKEIFGSGYVFETRFTTREGKIYSCPMIRLPFDEESSSHRSSPPSGPRPLLWNQSDAAAFLLRSALRRSGYRDVEVQALPWIETDPLTPWKVLIIATARRASSDESELEKRCRFVAAVAERAFGVGHRFETTLTMREKGTHKCPVVRLPLVDQIAPVVRIGYSHEKKSKPGHW